jgi:hypothetical protein
VPKQMAGENNARSSSSSGLYSSTAKLSRNALPHECAQQMQVY